MSNKYDKPLTPEQLATLNDADIDTSDIPEQGDGFWDRARLRSPRTDKSSRDIEKK